VCNQFDTIRYSLPHFFSILSAELLAIRLALETAAQFHHKYIICTDSLSALKCLDNYHDTSQHPIAKEIISQIALAPDRVIFAWLPGHKGIPGNIAADLAAKEASRVFPIPNIQVPTADVKIFLKRRLHEKWSNSWNAVPTENKLKLIKPVTDFWSTSARRNRREEVTLCRLRIGHTHMTHSYLLNKSPQPICQNCSVPLSVRHVLIDCPAYSAIRSRLSLSSSLPDLLRDDERSVSQLFIFLRSRNLLSLI